MDNEMGRVWILLSAGTMLHQLMRGGNDNENDRWCEAKSRQGPRTKGGKRETIEKVKQVNIVFLLEGEGYHEVIVGKEMTGVCGEFRTI